MTLTKANIVEAIESELNLPRKRCTELVEHMIEILKSTLESKEDVLISVFGKFCVKKRQKEGAGIQPPETLSCWSRGRW